MSPLRLLSVESWVSTEPWQAFSKLAVTQPLVLSILNLHIVGLETALTKGDLIEGEALAKYSVSHLTSGNSHDRRAELLCQFISALFLLPRTTSLRLPR